MLCDWEYFTARNDALLNGELLFFCGIRVPPSLLKRTDVASLALVGDEVRPVVWGKTRIPKVV